MGNKIKLFQTAKKICERGDISLSAADQRRIENETKELLRKSMSYRAASGTSKGFKRVLFKLGKAKNAAEAFKVVARYLAAEDMLNVDISDILEEVEEAVEDIGESLEQAEEVLGGGDKGKEKDEDKGKDKPKPEKEDDDEDEDDEELDFEDGPPKKESPKEESGDVPPQFQIDKAKEAVVRLAQEFDKSMDMTTDKGPGMGKGPCKDKDKEKGPGMGQGPGKDKEKGFPGKKPTKLKDLNDKDKGEEKITEDEMGIEKGPSTGGVLAKVKVSITPDKNIVASYANQPLFLAIPNAAVKRNPEKLRRAANKVLGLVIYDGPRVAAAKCGVRLMAGVDEDIILDSQAEVPANKENVTDDAETVTREEQPGDPNTALEENDTDTADKPDKVTAIRKRLERKRARLRRKAEDTILDDNEDLSVATPAANPNSLDVTDGSDTDTDTNYSKPSDMLDGGETDIKSVEANYKKLYANRAKKEAAEKTKKFVNRFARCMKIAAKRMALNHDDNPMKAAALDILTADNVRFSDGERFAPMDNVTAKEIVELIAAESHDNFISHLMDRTSNLMNKSEAYLEDVEADMETQVPRDVEVEDGCDAPPKKSRKSAKLRAAASEGNFNFNPNFVGSVKPAEPVNLIRDAMGSTKIGQRTARLKAAAGR